MVVAEGQSFQESWRKLEKVRESSRKLEKGWTRARLSSFI